MKTWKKYKDRENKYAATFELGDRTVILPKGAVISITRGEYFSLPRLLVNGLLNHFVMKTMINNSNLLYAELTGQLQGGVGQTMTVWKNGKSMNQFRKVGFHNFARKFFGWVFYSGRVQSYFLTWENQGYIPTSEEATFIVKKYGRHFDGGKLRRKSSTPKL
ncbi:hypothetical protein [Bacillus sp. JJ722]|uniref:hypothetical protein n=1 Tax=Bacillus sp. JJ722 TaxID=3122973 RepID=UPI002FFE26E1